MAATPEALAARNEVTWRVGGEVTTGPGHLAGGVGGGPGYRRYLTDAWSVSAEVQWLLLAGNTVWITTGTSYEPLRGEYRPYAGLFVSAVFGSHLRTLSSESPRTGWFPPLGLQLGVAPLRFVSGRVVASALEARFGVGTSRERPALVLSVSLVEVGVRF